MRGNEHKFIKNFKTCFHTFLVCLHTYLPFNEVNLKKKKKSLASMNLWAFPPEERFSDILVYQRGPLIYHS